MKTVKRDLIATCVRSCVAMVALCLGALHAGAAINITSNTQLSGDTDYRGQGVVTIAADVTLDLNGHKLYVDGLSGAGTVTDSKCYEILEYVQATGKQCVPTDYTPGTDTKLEVDFAPQNSSGANATVFGTTTFSQKTFLCMVNKGNVYFFGEAGHMLPVAEDVRYRSIVSDGTMSLFRQTDGAKSGSVDAIQDNAGNGNLTFFATPQTANRNGQCKLYGARAWHANELRLDLVPVRRAGTGEVGLFNRVNDAFLSNTTTTPLVAGAATGETFGGGSLLVTATDVSALSGFTGTVDRQVRTIFNGEFAFSFVFGSTQLPEDTDYRGKGTVTIAANATLDLNGHKLLADGLAGTGAITDSKCYEILEYVQATGNQCVPTDYTPGPDTKLEVDFAPKVNIANHTLYGTTRFSAQTFLCMVHRGNFYFFGDAGHLLPVDDDVRYRSIVRAGTISLIRQADATPIGSVSTTQVNVDNGNLVFFYTPNAAGYYKLYGARAWHAQELRLDLVPVRRADSYEAGLFNRVNGSFFANITTTPLAAGAATGATLGVGSLRVAATDGSALSAFAGTVDPQVRTFVDGDFSLSAEADWRAFGECAIDGNIDLNGHDLQVSTLGGLGSVTDSGSAYDRLEYVACDGRQRVLTGVVPGPKTALELELVFTPESALKSCTVFGCKSWSTNRWLMFLQDRYFYYFGQGVPALCQPEIGTRYRVEVTPTVSSNGTVTVTDVATGRQIASKVETLINEDNSGLALFSRTDNLVNPGAFRLCSFKISEDGEVVRDFTPVRHVKTGVAGLLDSVTGKFFTSNTGTGLLAGPTVVPAGKTGCLRVDVPKDASCSNAGLALKGALTLVKEGEGTLTVLKENQAYLGGTDVLAGELTLGLGAVSADFAASQGYLGPIFYYLDEARASVLVSSNAVFDFKGNVDYRYYGITLAGGTLRNGGRTQGEGSGSLGKLALTADSRLEAIRSIVFFDSVQLKLALGGHTLLADTCDSRIYFRNGLQITDGTLSAVGSGDLYFNSAVEARTAELRVACPLFVNAAVDVRDYYAACTTNVNGGTAAMNVYGRFTPETDYFYGCTLQDGSVLDLDAREGVWPTVSAFTNGLNRVTFAEGATVTVDAHVRKRWSGKVVDWGEGNRPVNVTFRMSPESRLLGRRLRVCPDGLYAVAGFNIIVR